MKNTLRCEWAFILRLKGRLAGYSRDGEWCLCFLWLRLCLCFFFALPCRSFLACFLRGREAPSPSPGADDCDDRDDEDDADDAVDDAEADRDRRRLSRWPAAAAVISRPRKRASPPSAPPAPALVVAAPPAENPP